MLADTEAIIPTGALDEETDHADDGRGAASFVARSDGGPIRGRSLRRSRTCRPGPKQHEDGGSPMRVKSAAGATPSAPRKRTAIPGPAGGVPPRDPRRRPAAPGLGRRSGRSAPRSAGVVVVATLAVILRAGHAGPGGVVPAPSLCLRGDAVTVTVSVPGGDPASARHDALPPVVRASLPRRSSRRRSAARLFQPALPKLRPPRLPEAGAGAGALLGSAESSIRGTRRGGRSAFAWPGSSWSCRARRRRRGRRPGAPFCESSVAHFDRGSERSAVLAGLPEASRAVFLTSRSRDEERGVAARREGKSSTRRSEMWRGALPRVQARSGARGSHVLRSGRPRSSCVRCRPAIEPSAGSEPGASIVTDVGRSAGEYPLPSSLWRRGRPARGPPLPSGFGRSSDAIDVAGRQSVAADAPGSRALHARGTPRVTRRAVSAPDVVAVSPNVVVGSTCHSGANRRGSAYRPSSPRAERARGPGSPPPPTW